MKFVVEIELGNDAMRTRTHIATALQGITVEVFGEPIKPGTEKKIRDVNGNTVGSWKYVGE